MYKFNKIRKEFTSKFVGTGPSSYKNKFTRPRSHKVWRTLVYRIKYSTVLWLLELQIRGGRKVLTQVHAVQNNSRNSYRQFNLFKKQNPIIRIFCIFGWLAVPFDPDKWSSTVFSW